MALCGACRRWFANALDMGHLEGLQKSLPDLSMTDLNELLDSANDELLDLANDELLDLANDESRENSRYSLRPEHGFIFTKAEFEVPRELAEIWHGRDTCWMCSWLGLLHEMRSLSHPDPHSGLSDANGQSKPHCPTPDKSPPLLIDFKFRIELHVHSTDSALYEGAKIRILVVIGSRYEGIALESHLDNYGVWQLKLNCKPKNRPIFRYNLSLACTGELNLSPVDRSAANTTRLQDCEERVPPSAHVDLLAPCRVSKIQSWLKTCIEEHQRCATDRDLSKTQSFLPTRLLLINEEPNEPRLLETRSLPAGEIVRYATLSHCWGQKQPLTLTDRNYSELLQTVPLRKLQRTFREAIQVCRKLGIKYLWIDCLCIIQNSVDDRDWHIEASRMHHIYGYSLLNLSAASSADGDGGLLRRWESALRDTVQIHMPCGAILGENFYHSSLSRLKSFVDSPLLRRGWVLQELFLAPRVLHFMAGQHLWQCKQSSHLEIDEPMLGRMSSPERPDLSKYRFLYSQTVSATNSIQDLDLLWSKLSEDYSPTLVTKPEDRYYALAGLVVLFAARYSDLGVRTVYVTGLWSHNIIGALPWRGIPHDWDSTYPLVSNISVANERLSAPSWSPLRSHNVYYIPKMGELRDLATLETMDVDRLYADIMAGPVNYAHLYIVAPFLDIANVGNYGHGTFTLIPKKDEPAIKLPHTMRLEQRFDDRNDQLLNKEHPESLRCSCILLKSEIRPGPYRSFSPKPIRAVGLIVKETQRVKDECMCYVRAGFFEVFIQFGGQEENIQQLFQACDSVKTPLWLI